MILQVSQAQTGELLVEQDVSRFFRGSKSLFQERILLLQGLVPFLDRNDMEAYSPFQHQQGGVRSNTSNIETLSWDKNTKPKDGKDGRTSEDYGKSAQATQKQKGKVYMLDALMLWLLRIDVDLGTQVSSDKGGQQTNTTEPEVGAGTSLESTHLSEKSEERKILDSTPVSCNGEGGVRPSILEDSIPNIVALLQAQVMRSLREGLPNSGLNRQRIATFFSEVMRISRVVENKSSREKCHPHLAAEVSRFVSHFYPRVSDNLIKAAFKGRFAKDLQSRRRGGYVSRRVDWLLERNMDKQLASVQSEVDSGASKEISSGDGHKGFEKMSTVAENDNIEEQGV